MDIADLKSKSVAELHEMAEELTRDVMAEVAKIKTEMEAEGYLRLDPQTMVRHLVGM